MSAESAQLCEHVPARNEYVIVSEDAPDICRFFEQGSRGCRRSFASPDYPNLEDHEMLVGLLGIDKIGVEMSDEHKLWSDQPTSALVVRRPGAKDFTT